jgi:hypothetical protein
MSVEKKFRRMMGRLRCWLLRHEPDRRRVRKQASGRHYGYCRYCGTQLRRRGYSDWEKFAWESPDDDQFAG